MSAFDLPDTSNSGGWGGRDLGDADRRVLTYLADKARNGSIFVKSSRVADDLDLTAERTGQAIALLRRESATLEIDRWSADGQPNATWHVECVGPTPYGRDCTDCDRIIPEAADACPSCGRRVGR